VIAGAGLLVCPTCRTAIEERGGEPWCPRCARGYPVVDGVPVLLPEYEDEERREAYRLNYERIASDDLDSPIVANRFDLMHRDLLAFIGDTRGTSVLDIGSAYGSYLVELPAARRVAVDIALPYLRHLGPESGVVRVCGDAEHLPVHAAAFDVIVISDVLEHLLDPAALVAILAAECRPGARIVVHIPWRESLEQYEDVPYEFTHMRSFDEYSFRSLFAGFDVTRERDALPRLDQPLVFRLKRFLPRGAYNAFVHLQQSTMLAQLDADYRERWIRDLPERRWLLRVFEPQVKLFELRRREVGSARRFVGERADALLRRWAARGSRPGPAEASPAHLDEARR
jgi:SAM-dependent methyltransferase